MKQQVLYSIVFSLIGLIAGVITIMMQIPNLPEETINQVREELGYIEILYIVGGIQIGLLTGVLSFIGQLMLPKTGFILFPKWTKHNIITSIGIGAIGAVVIVLSDTVIFASVMNAINTEYQFSLLYFSASILYGGIIEEIIMRLFLLTGIVVITSLIIKKQNKYTILTAILLSSFLFGLGHLPAMALITDLTPLIIIRTITINMIPAIAYGFLYTKKGLSYSIVAHISTHIVLQLILGPIFL